MQKVLPSSNSDTYLDLVRAFPLRPIRTLAAHRQAMETLHRLESMRGSAVKDYVIVLASLVAEFEKKANLRIDTSKVTAADIVMHLLEERGMSVNALAKAVSISQSSLSEMLNGRRGWSKQAIIQLSNYFGLQPGLFLR